ncbi:hypothetical protein BGY98DRAFT_1080774 [Russula aff. rugulosa BPL654]|nr:hypothetical protein BGY98DRAFT_1080774 [Russula aff. rugulosa BPL654]
MKPNTNDCPWRHTRNQQLLTSLRESIVDKPPYISGTLELPDSFFSLFYKVAEDGHTARHINFSDATPDELEQLTQACEPASSGVRQEHVLDESYHKVGKMDFGCFASTLDPIHTDLMNIIRNYLLEGVPSIRNIKVELYKLNVYGKGSSFKPHVDTPRSKKMFGSLVVVFPTFHEGGALLLRHRGHEWIFDSGQALAGAANGRLSIGYAAILNDIEYGVTQVTSGHRVTLTYNLYFDDGGPVSENDAVSKQLLPLKPPNQEIFQEAFKTLLENPEFMADGGMLAFGLRHVYRIEGNLKRVHNVLKGSDVVVRQSMRALGFEPVLYVYFDDPHVKSPVRGVIVDQLSKTYEADDEEETILHILQSKQGGILVCQDGWEISEEDCDDPFQSEMVEWVTPVTVYNRQETVLHYYDEVRRRRKHTGTYV